MQIRRMPAKSRILWGFLLLMLACTFISRIYDSVTVPKVLTTTAKQKAVETLVEGTGTVTVKEKQFCSVYPQLRVKQTAVIPGSEVKEGDTLFWYDMESILEKKEELQAGLEKIRINIEKEQVSQESGQGLTQEETAGKLERFLSDLFLPRDHILLIAPPPMRRGEWVPSQRLIDDSRTFAQCFRSLAKRLDARFADAGDWNIPMAYDGVHFTEQGHRTFSAGLFEALK